MCPLSNVDLWFTGMFFCGALANFLKTVLLVSIPLLYLHVAYGVRVYLNPSFHTEVIDKEVYTLSGVKISLLQAKAQKAKCK